MPGEYDLQKLLFRRQFALGPYFVDALPWWKRLRVGKHLCLTVHPDLNTHQCVREERSLTLLGYILDPHNPNATDADILGCLIEKVGNFNLFLEQTNQLGGRWVLITADGNDVRLVNDALGFRQIFYADKTAGEDVWCASQTGILRETLKLEYDHNTLEQLYGSYERDDGQYWWPNDRTPFKEIKHLLPNHYLDLTSGVGVRYWPNEALREVSLEESIESGAKLLRGLIASAANRYELAFTITAGRDTRLLLAASREISREIYFFTMMYWRMTKKSVDIVVPSRLLKELGLSHHVIKCPPQMDDKFKEIYARNVPTAREVYGTIAQGLYDHYPEERICVKGNASAVVKYKKLPSGDRQDLSGAVFAKWQHFGKNSFAASEFDKWLGTAKGSAYNIDMVTLTW